MYTNSYTGTLIAVIVEALQTITGRLDNYLSKKDGIIIAISDIIDAFYNTTRRNEKGEIKEE